MADAMKLLPCPFCGDDDPEVTGENGWVWIACTTGSDCAGRGPDSDDEASAIEAWNRRASPPAREEAPAEGAGVKKACAVFQEAIDDFEADVADVLSEDSERADLWDREITVNIDTLKTVMSAALRNRTSEPEAGEEGLAYLNDLREAAQSAYDSLIELNEFNYTHEDVCEANVGAVGAMNTLHAALTRLRAHPAPATADKMRELDELVAACEAEFCSPGTEGQSWCYGEDDDAEVAYPKSNITFGLIRRARQALAALNEGPA